MVEEIWDVESWEIFTDESDREESEIPAEKAYYPCREVLTKYCKTMMVYCKCPEDLCPYINKMTHLIHHNSHLLHLLFHRVPDLNMLLALQGHLPPLMI